MHPVRKRIRLDGWNYSSQGAYFLTVCSKDRKAIFSRIVGRDILDAPDVQLSNYGQLIYDAIVFLSENTPGVMIHNFVIMPNHVHLLVSIEPVKMDQCGASGMPRPTEEKIPRLISSLKRFTNRKAGFDMWQVSYYDHIIRDDEDFIRRWRYIDNNPYAWLDDDYYTE